MSDVLKEEFLLLPEIESDLAATQDASTDVSSDGRYEVFDRNAENRAGLNDRISPHSQDRLSRHMAVSESNAQMSEDLNRISEALSNIVAANRMGRDLLNDYFADIHRSNEFENANAAYAGENRRLGERVDKLERLRARYDQLVDVLKRREAKLMAEAEELREIVATAKFELVEAQTGIARSESLNGELRAALSSRTSEAERYMRNAELLREKGVGLTLDLELSNKKHAESRRKADELAAMHASDTARLSELTARLAAEENESARLQKLADSVEAQIIDLNESVARTVSEMTERDKRHQSENGALKSEIHTLHARLQTAAGEHRDALSDAAGLRSRIADLESEKQIMDQKFADMRGELEGERRQIASAASVVAEDASVTRDDAERMRREIAELKATVARLSHGPVRGIEQDRAPPTIDEAGDLLNDGARSVPDFSRAKASVRS